MSYREMRLPWKHTTVIMLAVLPVLLVSLPAFAESRQAKERNARKACLDGDYARGVAILSDLFLATMDSTYIFNQARCYEQNGRYETAIARFEEYLRSSLPPQTRASAEKHLEDCRKNLAKERESITPPTVLAPPPTVPAPAPRTEPEPKAEISREVATETASASQPPSQRRWGLITAGIVTGTLGVGGLVAGLLFHQKADSMVNDWEKKPDSYTSSKENTQKTYRTLSGVSYGVGAAMIVTGTVLIVVGASPRAQSSSNLTLAPAVGPGLAGAVLTGAF